MRGARRGYLYVGKSHRGGPETQMQGLWWSPQVGGGRLSFDGGRLSFDGGRLSFDGRLSFAEDQPSCILATCPMSRRRDPASPVPRLARGALR
jgi:hypothetical protein